MNLLKMDVDKKKNLVYTTDLLRGADYGLIKYNYQIITS